jgi:hypothetical protein
MNAEHTARVELAVRVADLELDAEPLRARSHDRKHLRMRGRVDEEHLFRALARAPDHRHRLRRGSGFVEQRGVGDRQAGEIDDELLESEQRFEAPLRDLGLVGRVGGVPARVLQHVALDHGRRMRAVVPHADVASPHLVVHGVRAEIRQCLQLGLGGAELERLLQPDGNRDDLAHQRIERAEAKLGEHLALLRLIAAQMPSGELFLPQKIGEIAHAPADFL